MNEGWERFRASSNRRMELPSVKGGGGCRWRRLLGKKQEFGHVKFRMFIGPQARICGEYCMYEPGAGRI